MVRESKQFSEITYVYALLDPRTNDTRYVGQSNNPEARLYGHLDARALAPRGQRQAPTPMQVWLKELRDIGLKPDVVVLEEVGVGSNPLAAERKWIARLYAEGAELFNREVSGTRSLFGETLMELAASREIVGSTHIVRYIEEKTGEVFRYDVVDAHFNGSRRSDWKFNSAFARAFELTEKEMKRLAWTNTFMRKPFVQDA